MASWEPDHVKGIGTGMGLAIGIPVLVFGAIIVAAFVFVLTRVDHNDLTPAHTCVSPCVVVLPGDTQEDGWYVDYGWRDKHTPVLGVHTCPKGDMSGRCG